MAKVRGLIPEQKFDYQRRKMADKLDVILYKNNISKADLAEKLDVTVQAVYSQFSTKKITMPTLMAIVTMADVDAEELKEMLEVIGL